MLNLESPPTPIQLFRLFRKGRISREDLHEAMAVHARGIIEEMEEAHRNPVAALVDELVSRKAASRLASRYGEFRIREILVALSEVPDFPPAALLWQAGHIDVPLHCFVRPRREPVFRVLKIHPALGAVRVVVEHGAASRRSATREEITLRRQPTRRLAWEERRMLNG